ncbi:hypothetical protein TNIN_147771 [Trichonephila inaurata madagascariensis]|uniref:Uncharacterized protein n=1 Tax=Trichonephila inaurata madagascariensis TaxID=2747483 RepID=A0A8X6XC41_9ARAC|nr:hypothetical protein TNIN_147771 [Trichonephila inaurata madagascariensis]
MSHAHPRPRQTSVCRLKHQKVRARVLGKTTILTIRRGVKKRYFSTCVVPREIRGPMRGLKDGAVARKPVQQHFLMSVVQVEDIILGNRGLKLASDHLTARNRAALYTPPQH